MLQPDDELLAAIAESADYDSLREMSRGKGMRTLRESGITLTQSSRTSFDEILRVTPES